MNQLISRVSVGFALGLGAFIVFSSSSSALVDPGEGFDPRRIPIELQSWWSPNFGHIHAGTRLPLGQEVSGVLRFDVRIVLHNNPGRLKWLRIGNEDDTIVAIPLDLRCPYDGSQSLACAYNVPVELDTHLLQDGWRELRIRAMVETPDGLDYFNSSGIPLRVSNGGSSSDYDRFCNNTSLIGRGWYEGFDYTNAIIECVPLQPLSGIHTFRVRSQNDSGGLTVALDKTHFIPAVGPYPDQLASPGQILFDEEGEFDDFFPITIDTRTLANGWHTLAVTSTGPVGATSSCDFCDFELNFPSGVAKTWFFVNNGPLRFEVDFESGGVSDWTIVQN